MSPYEQHLFDGKCPYTEKPCDTEISCAKCALNEQEKRATEEMDKAEYAEYEEWNGIHAQITAPKGTFEKIFNDAEEGEGE